MKHILVIFLVFMLFPYHYLLSQYCVPTSTYGPQYGTYIESVQLEDIINLHTGDSSNPTYNNYSHLSTILYKDSTYQLIITGSPYYNNMYYYAWIDYNRDYDFYDSDEQLGWFVTTSQFEKNTIQFTIPDSCKTGNLRLRVLTVYNVPNQNPCGPFTYGEIEDYTVKIQNAAIFQEINAGLDGTSSGSVKWVDIDADGDLEPSVIGKYSTFLGNRAQLYRNNGNNLFELKKTFTELRDGDHDWFDYDNDGDMDYVFSGNNAHERAGLYRFDGIDVGDNFNFTLLFDNLFHYTIGSDVAWGDYDNDGDYDLLLTGQDTLNEVVIELFENTGGSFTKTDVELPGIYYGDVEFIDFDLDCDLDLFILGTDNNTNTLTRLMVNDNGKFTEFDFQFPNIENGNFDWQDFNGDGYPDVLINGYSGTNDMLNIYLSDSASSFYASSSNLPGGNTGDVSMGDINNDGLHDIVIHGPRADALDSFPVFINIGNDSLELLPFQTYPLRSGTIALGDYDNDNDLDLLVNGYKYINMATNAYYSKIFENESVVSNTPPTAPTGLEVELYGQQVLLKWNHATDNSTPIKSLTYNIYMGTSSKGEEIVSPHANISNGERFLSIPGYIQDTCWIVRDLNPGTYYWSVQAIDNSQKGSVFAAERSFVIKDRFDQKCTTVPYEKVIHSWDFDSDGDHDLLNLIDDTLHFRKNLGDGFRSITNDTVRLSQLGRYWVGIGNIAPADYDNDSDIDFVVSGDFDSLAYIIEKSGVNFLIDSSRYFYNTKNGFGLWCDLDNDGLQDYITSGTARIKSLQNMPATFVYENNGDKTFSLTNHNIPPFQNCGGTYGDFDNDMDMDILIFGQDSNEVPKTSLFLNNGDFTFEEQNISNCNLQRFIFELNDVFPGDFNQDGKLDFYIAGRDSVDNKYARIMINNGKGFTDIGLDIRCWDRVGNYWIDYDNDGDLDVISYSASNLGYNYVKIYLIEDEEIIEELSFEYEFEASNSKQIHFKNYDNEFSTDFVYPYHDGGHLLCSNHDNWGSPNYKELSPTKLSAVQKGFDIVVSWSNRSGKKGLSYNLRVGTSKYGSNIISPESNILSGYRYITKPGNTSIDTAWKISDLPVGTYYCSVQAVDNAYEGGYWSRLIRFRVADINVDFTFNEACAGDTTFFTNITVSNDTIVKWNWIYDGDTISNDEHTSIVFNEVGDKIVELQAITNAGAILSKKHTVTLKNAPIVDFLIQPVCLGDISSIVNQSDTSAIEVESWLWDFGNGETSTYRGNVTKTYTSNTLVSLIISATNGCVTSRSKTAFVGTRPNPVVSIEDGKVNSCSGDTVKLVTQYSDEFTYRWLVDDVPVWGENDTLITLFNRPTGSFNYAVEVSNKNGACSVKSTSRLLRFNANPPKPIIFNHNESSICQGDSAKLQMVVGEAHTYQWYRNDELTNHRKAIAHVILGGNYALKIYDSLDCESEKSDIISINTKPIPIVGDVLIVGSTKFCEGEVLTIQYPENQDYNYQWQKNDTDIDGSTASEINISESGIYQLLTTNSVNCTVKSSPYNVQVAKKPEKPILDVKSAKLSICPNERVMLKPKVYYPNLQYHWYYNDTLFDPVANAILDTLLPEGNFRVVCSNIECESESDIVTIQHKSVIDSIFFQIFGPKVWYIGCLNESAKAYRWYYNGTLIDDERDHICMVNQKFGNYQLAISDGSECWVFTDTITIPNHSYLKGSIEENNDLKSKLYPNPGSGVIYLELISSKKMKYSVRLYNNIGLLFHQSSNKKLNYSDLIHLDISAYPPGIYFVDIRSNQNRIIHQLVIEH
ncbi:MAG: FG-GAP-like repeat-containing protein [Bacteroidales bacterium]|nr:FG-GAP-like repeat-containing protein [Bacteroidales bacterium]